MSTTPTPGTDTTDTEPETSKLHKDDIPDRYTPETLRVKNIGGITDTEINLQTGINILTGENATNRTSLLTALNGILGGTEPTLRRKTDEGMVELNFTGPNNANQPFRRVYKNTDGRNHTIETDGAIHPDPEIVDTFATLLEHNDARRAVETGDDELLRDVLTRPIDTAHIERRVKQLETQKNDLQTQQRNLNKKLSNEPGLIEQQQTLQDEITDLEAEIEAKQDEIESREADVEMAEEAQDLVAQLESKRNDKAELQEELDVLRAELDTLEDQLEDRREKYDGLPSLDKHIEENTTFEDQIEQQKQTVDELEREKSKLEDIQNQLFNLREINQNIEERKLPGITPDDKDVTDALNPDQELDCWVCGSRVEKSTIESRLEELKNLAVAQNDDIEALEDEIESEREKLNQMQGTVEERRDLENRIESLESEIESLNDDINAKQTELDTLTDEITELETRVEETADLQDSDLPSIYDERGELKTRLGRKQNKLERIEEKLDDVEDAKTELDDVEDELEDVNNELASLRDKVETLEKNTVELFNDNMEDVLDALDYDNIERVWIERLIDDDGRTARPSTFELHIVRDSDTGVFDDTVDNLSESEREVIGLIAALTGYIAHDIDAELPFILIDSVEAVDADRLVTLIEYFAEHAEVLTVALLPEDAAAFPEGDNYNYVTAEDINA